MKLLTLLLTSFILLIPPSYAFTQTTYTHESKEVEVESVALGQIRHIKHYHSHTGGPVHIGQRFWVSVTISSDESGDVVVPVVFSTLTYKGCKMEEIIYDNTTTASKSARMRFWANMENEDGNATTDAYACRWAFRSTASNGGTQLASIQSDGFVPRILTPLLLTDELGGYESYERNLNRTILTNEVGGLETYERNLNRTHSIAIVGGLETFHLLGGLAIIVMGIVAMFWVDLRQKPEYALLLGGVLIIGSWFILQAIDLGTWETMVLVLVILLVPIILMHRFIKDKPDATDYQPRNRN